MSTKLGIGELVTLSAKSLAVKSGGWPSVRETYNVGVVIDVQHANSYWPLFTVMWNNGNTRIMRREEIKRANVGGK
jgi:hypothetical protein